MSEVGECPLTPIESWFFDHATSSSVQSFNQSVCVEASQRVTASQVRSAMHRLARRHDAWRSRFDRTSSGSWRHVVLSREASSVSSSVMVSEADVSGVWSSMADAGEASAAEREAMQAIADEAHRSLDISRGPVARAVVVDRGAGRRQAVVIVAHHLVVDGVSWRVLLDDMERMWSSSSSIAAASESDESESVGMSWREWSSRLVIAAASHESMRSEAAVWQSLVGSGDESWWRPFAERSESGGRRSWRVTASSMRELDEETTRRLIEQAGQAVGGRIDDVLVSAVSLAVGRCGGSSGSRVGLSLEGHGRDALSGIDESASEAASEMVGWFTSMFMLCVGAESVDESSASSVRGLVKRVKEQLRSAPRRGSSQGLVRRFGTSAAAWAVRSACDRASPQVLFNYLGQWDESSSSSLETSSCVDIN